jgi:hypothetical protein
MPDQLQGRPSTVTGRRGIQIEVVPVVANDLKPFFETVERTAKGIPIERRRKDTYQLGHRL